MEAMPDPLKPTVTISCHLRQEKRFTQFPSPTKHQVLPGGLGFIPIKTMGKRAKKSRHQMNSSILKTFRAQENSPSCVLLFVYSFSFHYLATPPAKRNHRQCIWAYKKIFLSTEAFAATCHFFHGPLMRNKYHCINLPTSYLILSKRAAMEGGISSKTVAKESNYCRN